jgi:CDP-glycerol glycerophosphotransferase
VAGQVFVQCWHGTPLKRLGYDVHAEITAALNTATELSWRYRIDAQKWSYLLSPSAYTSERLASAFGFASLVRRPPIVEVGYPRNDSISRVLNSPQREDYVAELKRRLGIPAGRKILLYAPTWRDSIYKAKEGYGLGATPDFVRMREALGEQWAILVRAHYLVEKWAGKGERLREAELGATEPQVEVNVLEKTHRSEAGPSSDTDFLINVSGVSDVNDLYLVADALLTDYSSVLFDFATTGRPTLYYWPDLKEYQQDIRGFYFDPATLPGNKCETTDELISAIAALDTWEERYGDAYRLFRTRFCPQDDGWAAERVIAKVFGAGGRDRDR